MVLELFQTLFCKQEHSLPVSTSTSDDDDYDDEEDDHDDHDDD